MLPALLTPGTEWIPIIILILLVFGAKRLPEIGKGLGRGIKNFRKSVSSSTEELSENSSESDTSEAEGKSKP